jgi:DNA-binding XRE family transcriptional regulator
MQEHMKKPHTDEVSMTFIGPVAMMGQALEVMSSLGFEEMAQNSSKRSEEGSIPWRESEFFKDVHAGTYLSGARYREDITQVELAERSGIPRRHISEMENGKRPIGKANARKLAEALNIEPRLLLSI